MSCFQNNINYEGNFDSDLWITFTSCWPWSYVDFDLTLTLNC